MDVDEILARCTIPTPCPMDWDAMRGDDRVRLCERCGKHVYDLPAMDLNERASLLADIRERGERRCVRLYQRPDGTLTASACQAAPPEPATPWQFTTRALMAAIAGWAAFLGLARWLTPEHKPPKAPPVSNSPIVGGCGAY
jgi:hypothetical protein